MAPDISPEQILHSQTMKMNKNTIKKTLQITEDNFSTIYKTNYE